MGLRIKSRSLAALRPMATLMMVFALAVQPMYGFVASQVASAVSESEPSLTFNVAEYVKTSDYTGVSMTATAKNITTATSLELQVLRGNGLAPYAIKASGSVLDSINTQSSASQGHTTSGTVIVSGSRSSSSWSPQTGAWSGTDRPIGFNVIVKLKDGRTISSNQPEEVRNAAIIDQVFADNVPPTIEFISPVAGTTIGNRISIEMSVSDAVSGVRNVNVHLLGAGMASQIIPLQRDGTTSRWFASNVMLGTQITTGNYGLVSRATDNAGNTQLANTNHGSVTVDRTAPNIRMINPVVNSLVSQKTEFKFEVKDDLSEMRQVNIHLIKGNESAKIIPLSYAAEQTNDGYQVWTAKDVDMTGLNGSYSIVSRAVDEHGNNQTGPQSIHGAITIDSILPKISVKDGYIGDKDAKIFSKVSFKLHDSHSADKYTINGHESDFKDSKHSDANFGNIKNHLREGEGNVLVLHDLAGNTSSYTFTYDATPPAGELSYSHGNQLTNADEIIVTLKTTEPVQEIGDGWERVGSDLDRFEKTFTANGKFTVSIIDIAGNEAEIKGEVKRIDRNVPIISGVDNNATVPGSVYLSIFDPTTDGFADGLDCRNSLMVNDETFVATPGAGKTCEAVINSEDTYTVIAKDKAGNESEAITFTIDTTAPTATKFTFSNSSGSGNGNVVTSEKVTVTMTTSEPVDTPIEWEPVAGSNTEFTRTYDTNGKYQVVLTDLAGNASVAQKFEVKRIDKVDPTFNIEDGATFRTPSVEVVITEENIDYVVDGNGKRLTHVGNKPYRVTVTGEGMHVVTAFDKAGNQASISFTIDSVAPVVEIDAPLLTNSSNPIITGIATDPEPGTGVKSHWFEIKAPNGIFYYVSGKDSFNLSEAKDNTIAKNPIVITDGDYRIRYVATDHAGSRSDDPNYTNSKYHTMKIDTTAPVVEVYGIQAVVFGNDVIVAGVIDDLQIQEVTIIIDGTPYTTNVDSQTGTFSRTFSNLQEGNYEIQVHVRDEAGNTNENRDVLYFAVVNPVIADKPSGEDETKSPGRDGESSTEGDAPAGQVVTVNSVPGSIAPLGSALVSAFAAPAAVATPAANAAVLGDQDVLGTSDTAAPSATADEDAESDDEADTSGLAWYWWLLIALVGIGAAWWIIAALRRRIEDEE